MTVDLLRNRTILIVSPNEWGDMRLSKHHYAEALARRGNRVFYLNPPSSRGRDRLRIEQVPEIPGLSTISYRPFVSYAIRFRSRFIFDQIVAAQVRWLLKRIGVQFDVVWCFDSNLYTDLRVFQAPLKIFHPVDQISLPHQIAVAAHADVVLSVSESILAQVRNYDTPQLRIEHGIGPAFVDLAQRRLAESRYRPRLPLKAAYVGNLQMPYIDRSTMLEIVSSNKEVEFHLWGPRTNSESNVGTDSSGENAQFMARLEAQPNVFFHGVVTPSRLAAELEDADLLFMCYDVRRDPNRGCNSHKILEYLSTGRAIVANFVSDYASRSELIEMASENGRRTVTDVFRGVVQEVASLNADGPRRARALHALSNSYEKQIERIACFISANVAARGRDVLQGGAISHLARASQY